MDKTFKKEGNVLYPNQFFQRSKEQQEEVSFQKAGGGKVVPFDSSKNSAKTHRIRDEKPYTSKELWINYGAAACVLMIMGGAVMLNFEKEANEGGRGLAFSEFESNRSAEGEFLEDLNQGRRELSSIGASPRRKASLEERENFQYNILDSYHISFGVEGYVSEAQLKPKRTPIYVESVPRFIEKYRSFFPSYNRLVERKFSGLNQKGFHYAAYRLAGTRLQVLFQLNQNQHLVSFAVENLRR